MKKLKKICRNLVKKPQGDSKVCVWLMRICFVVLILSGTGIRIMTRYVEEDQNFFVIPFAYSMIIGLGAFIVWTFYREEE